MKGSMFLDLFTLQQKDESNSFELFKHCSQALTSAVNSSHYIKSLIFDPDLKKKKTALKNIKNDSL